MGEIVNLRRVRREQAKAAVAQQAASNRVKHGRTKAEREASAKEEARSDRVVDGARLAPKNED